MDRVSVSGLSVCSVLHDFVNDEVLCDIGISPSDFWDSFARMLEDLTPKNRALLEEREDLQSRLNDWHSDPNNDISDISSYTKFLREIGYILPEGPDFTITTSGVDSEISTIAGPQLVVPVLNARFALNAANARWGSLYDALYGSDVISGDIGSGYDSSRGKRVIGWVRDFLDSVVPLTSDKSWHNITGFVISDSSLSVLVDDSLISISPDIFVGYVGSVDSPSSILLRHNGLHIDILIDRSHIVGSEDLAGISDVILESALTTIMDNEDSISAVDADDKVIAYRNWLGLMRGDLEEVFEKGDKRVVRRLDSPRLYTSPDGTSLSLKSQVLMLHRNVGHLMTNPSILLPDGSEVYEGLMDAMISAAIGVLDTGSKHIEGRRLNSVCGSMYVVKPKMHGAEETAFACETFSRVEDILGMSRNTIKIGIMDEERRMTVNLKESIRAASDRVVFINTGFLDRTGDEIFTSMKAGAMIRKGDMKGSSWLSAYEDRNVDIGLSCGFFGRAQIGKGMWAMPDRMSDMLEQKISHPESGANTSWVPSPTAATLHATHYHRVLVSDIQKKLEGRAVASLEDVLSVPVSVRPNWTDSDIQSELDNNAQGILGYVVRWVDSGVGCSKVPDINDVGLMEDRATLRISSTHMANWLLHGIVDESRIIETMKKMAVVVDNQNSSDPDYVRMSDDFDNSVAFGCAVDLVLKCLEQPSGYTEPLLHSARLAKKREGLSDDR